MSQTPQRSTTTAPLGLVRRAADPDRVALLREGPFARTDEPALLLTAGDPVAWNDACADAIEDQRFLGELADMAAIAHRYDETVRRVMPVRIGGRDSLIEFDVSPWPPGDALALGRDVTVATGVREALTLSRERYRALLEMAADCIWEAGLDGGFELISPNRVYDRPAVELIGKPASDLIIAKTPGFLQGRMPRTWRPAAIRSGSGDLILGDAIAEQILDPDTGLMTGVRGAFRRRIVYSETD